jgi:hypothetical protein
MGEGKKVGKKWNPPAFAWAYNQPVRAGWKARRKPALGPVQKHN